MAWKRPRLADRRVDPGPFARLVRARGLYVGNEVALDLSLLSAHWHDRVTTPLEVAAMVSVTIVLAAIAGQAVARVSERSAVGGGGTGLAHARLQGQRGLLGRS